jgi:putative heme iron utilization protein
VILISNLSSHTANLKADGRASVLLARTGKGDPLAHPRLTVLGAFSRIADEAEMTRLKARFLARNPEGADLYRLPGLQRLADEPLRPAISTAASRGQPTSPGRTCSSTSSDAHGLIAAEPGAIAHMNADHADAVSVYATVLAGEEPGPWKMSGADPEGFDLIAGDRTARVLFPRRVTTGEDLHKVLVQMVREARAKAA